MQRNPTNVFLKSSDSFFKQLHHSPFADKEKLILCSVDEDTSPILKFHFLLKILLI